MLNVWQKGLDWAEKRGWLARVPWIKRLGRTEFTLLVVALLIVWIGNTFIELADDVQEHETQKFDEWVVKSFRSPDDPSLAWGPPWLREAGIDITALGSVVVLTLVVLMVVGFLLLMREYRIMLLVIVAMAGGILLNFGLKQFFDRPRPDVVPHLREVFTPSFPSGHATLSAVVYLTLGALLMGVVKGRLTKIYCIGVAMLLTFLVGVSRVYLGVHYPTDVLAGWALGLAWALLCWGVEMYLKSRGAVQTIQTPEPDPDEEGDAGVVRS